MSSAAIPELSCGLCKQNCQQLSNGVFYKNGVKIKICRDCEQKSTKCHYCEEVNPPLSIILYDQNNICVRLCHKCENIVANCDNCKVKLLTEAYRRDKNGSYTLISFLNRPRYEKLICGVCQSDSNPKFFNMNSYHCEGSKEYKNWFRTHWKMKYDDLWH